MVRKFLLPALVTGLLGGCVTAGYDYRYGPGDYYYGQPSTEYRYYGAPYGYHPYGGIYGYSRYGYPYGYGGYYPYNHNYYGYPYRYPYYYYNRPKHPRPPVVEDPNPPPQPPRDGHKRNDYRVPPWRDLRTRPAVVENGVAQPRIAIPSPPFTAPPAPPRIEPRRDDGPRVRPVSRPPIAAATPVRSRMEEGPACAGALGRARVQGPIGETTFPVRQLRRNLTGTKACVAR
jgi:hypothetical protein